MAKHVPIIGISGSVADDEHQYFILSSYTGALRKAGAAPILLIPELEGEGLEGCLDRLDGVLLAGGNDVNPTVYGEWPIQELGEVNPLRDAFEQRLLRAAMERRMPVLGICRGIQMMNAALGGTLWQDLHSQYRTEDGKPPMRHQQNSASHHYNHEVLVEKGTLLHQIMGDERVWTNSFHHEAVKQPAPCLRVTAHAGDGVIEAVEHESLPYFVGVQWHPERSVERDAHARALFESFVQAAEAYGYGE